MIFNGTSSFDKMWDFLGNEVTNFNEETPKTGCRFSSNITYKFENSKLYISLPGYDNETADLYLNGDFIEYQLKEENNHFGLSTKGGIRIPSSFKPFEVRLESFVNGIAVLEFKLKNSKKIKLS